MDGFIIKLFDTEIHNAVTTQRSGLIKAEAVDERWVRITRPTVIVGGELTMDSLEVRYNRTTKISEASMQLKSNCGTLVIDDFGRQRMNPVEMLNRWIVPLEKRYRFPGPGQRAEDSGALRPVAGILDQPRTAQTWWTTLSCGAFPTKSTSPTPARTSSASCSG